MIYLATILLFMLAVVAIYAIIQTGKNNVITFFLIPLVLVSSIFTGYSIYVLQGTPVNTLPKGEVTVLWAEVQKPNIYFWLGMLTNKGQRITECRTQKRMQRRCKA